MLRREKGWNELEVIIVPYIQTRRYASEDRLSSTLIRNIIHHQKILNDEL